MTEPEERGVEYWAERIFAVMPKGQDDHGAGDRLVEIYEAEVTMPESYAFVEALSIIATAAWRVSSMSQHEHNTRRGIGSRGRNRQPFGGRAG